ncbi:hypothetical protein GXP67_16080 [Rhodocytophaga rosea]|uniref:DUF1444 family protein n=1 Tax=Rhodocytophaga rosea TaxID=2704465 RepID=A0A6C0GK92_9BACT|nr:hypothetical protein [Rhodocytophaga rosea]QHT68050.1 hypothetical protein GXP67_16080 [Rhodocytophaga rosea]
MRFILFLLSFQLLFFSAYSQKIDYSVPKDFVKYIDKQDYRKIIDASVAIISKRYQIDFVKKGAIHLKSGQYMEGFHVDNLINKCLRVEDKSKWETEIEEHFTNLFASLDEQKNINPEDFESIRKYLSLRIYSKVFIEQKAGRDKIIFETHLEDTYTVLMLDLPGAFATVDPGVFENWKQNKKEVFDIAQTNINKQQVEKITKTFQVDQAEVEISFLGNEDYAASYALDLIHNSPDLVGEWGSVIAVPNKGLVNICKISRDKPVEFVKFIQYTKAAVEQFYRQHPQPISNQYFWYYQDRFTRINVLTDAAGNINVIAPLGLAELMSEKK